MATEKGMTIAENKYNSYKASTPKIPEANKVSKQGDIGLSQQGAQTHQNGQVSKNNANVNQGQNMVQMNNWGNKPQNSK